MDEHLHSDSLEYHPGRIALNDPARPAVVMAYSGHVVTYGELDEFANRLSRLFRSLGLLPGDHIAFCLENRPEFLPIAWGAHYAGLYYTAISSRLTATELAYIVGDCGAKVLIVSPETAPAASDEALDQVDARFVVGGEVVGFEQLEPALTNHSAEPLTDRVEGADMLYSSGTTGRPKGVKPPLLNEPLGTAPALLTLLALVFSVEDGCVYLSPAPLYHAAPLRFTMSVLRVGGTAVVMERFDPERALGLIEEYEVTTSQWVPTMFVRMLKLEPSVRERYDLSTLKCAVHAAAPCPVEAKRAMIKWWGPLLHEYYAGTEGNGLCYVNSEDWLARPATVGRPLVGELHIVDDDGKECPVGTEGLVYFANGGTFKYHNDPAKTKASHMQNGWSTLGDIGWVDSEGFLYLTDRKSHMIISGGVNIYPQETENVLSMHEEVLDVAVIGVPNDDLGEEVKAVVQPVGMPNDSAEAALLEQRLIAYCRERLMALKCPRSVDFRSELPRHATGKLYKRLLRDEYWNEAEQRI